MKRLERANKEGKTTLPHSDQEAQRKRESKGEGKTIKTMPMKQANFSLNSEREQCSRLRV